MDDLTKGLIGELGLDGLSEKEKDDLVTTWAETLQDRITVEVMETMSPEEREAFNKLAETATEADLNNFMAEHIPDLDMIIEDEFDKFRSELIDENKQIKESLDKLKK
jgi:hypothetical protein